MEFLVTLQIEQRILAVLAVELFGHKINNDVVPILATQTMIAIGREHIDVVSFDSHDGDVESSATKIEYEHRLIFFEFVETVSERSRRRLINDLQDVEAGKLTRGDGSGSLCVVEIRWHRDDGIGDGLF